ncbi:MAG: 16S rRNA (cytidine(1402)-2'-O)-methyltransferase [Spirochaetia bacterium]
MSVLWIVGTPIGNLEDITFRAVRVLRESQLVLCEDTRQTRKLLSHYEISVPVTAFHAHTDDGRLQTLVERIERLDQVALVTDAGTPGLSGPGALLVEACLENEVDVRPVPGPSACTALVSVSAPLGRTVVFDGFLSPKGGRRRSRLRELIARGEPFILYESPHRIVKLLRDLADEYPEAHVLVGREMTKTFEEFLRGKPGEIADILDNRGRIRGEFTVLVRLFGMH